ncbi:hypothetical protein BDR06DRAFT_1010227 [Suillus hirtellus]|nr:hypothetical protein BDR06DRAFT_1010227 [Suillus hirtellus]
MGSSNTICAVQLPIIEDIPIDHELDHIWDAFNHSKNGYLMVSPILGDPTIFECILQPIQGLDAIANDGLYQGPLSILLHSLSDWDVYPGR